MTDLLEHSFKPGTVTTGLEPDNHFPLEARVELSHLLGCMVEELLLMNFTITDVTPLDELLPCVKINAKIDTHGDSFLVLKPTAVSVMLAVGGSHLLHHISLINQRSEPITEPSAGSAGC